MTDEIDLTPEAVKRLIAEIPGYRPIIETYEIQQRADQAEHKLAQAVEVLKSAREHIAYSAPEWHYRTRDMVASIDATIAKIGGDT